MSKNLINPENPKMERGAPSGMFDRMRQQVRELEDKDLQIFEAQTQLDLVQRALKVKEARLDAVEEERRVVGIELQAANATKMNLQETLVQRLHSAK